MNETVHNFYSFYLAMEARSKKMMNNQFLLIDHNDTSRYKSIQMYTDNAINPCISSSYAFIRKVIESLVIYHKDIMPLKIYHFGGDEVASGAWENSTACEDLMKNKWQVRRLTQTHKEQPILDDINSNEYIKIERS